PLLYRFRVIDKLPERPSPEAVRGTLVHSVLERLYDLPRGTRTSEQATGMVAAMWERMLADKPDLAALFTSAGGGDGEGEGHGDGEGDGEGDGDKDGEDLAAWLASARQLLERYFRLEDPNRLEPAERELFVETTLTSGLRLRGFVDRLDV